MLKVSLLMYRMSKINTLNDPLITPNELKNKIPIDNEFEKFINISRKVVTNILNGKDKRKLIIVKPSNINNFHDVKQYGLKLQNIATQLQDKFFIIIQVYFKNTLDINNDLYDIRDLIYYLNKMGVPCGYDILDTITYHYISDLVSWCLIGSSPIESQIVSGLTMPVGFINDNIEICTDAINNSKIKNSFMDINDNGQLCISNTNGNYDTQIILNGTSNNDPNDRTNNIQQIKKICQHNNIVPKIIIDCSHNDSRNQQWVFKNVMKQINDDEKSIVGLILESSIIESCIKLLVL